MICSADGKLTYATTVPDTITSWVVSAFALSQETGLGVADTTKVRDGQFDGVNVQHIFQLRVFRPFFVRLNLPYSVKRSEKLALQALIFNYEEEPQTVTLTLKHNSSAGFEFVKKDGSILTGSEQTNNYNARQILVGNMI
jgi:CD109 antigen